MEIVRKRGGHIAPAVVAALFVGWGIAADRPNMLFILADDLGRDPGERNGVAVEHPEVVQDIARLVETSNTESTEFPVKPRTGQAPRP